MNLSINLLCSVPAAVNIASLVPTATTVVVNFNPPVPANGVIVEYYVLYSDTATFRLPESMTYSAPLTSAPVIRRLIPDTTYYVKVSAGQRGHPFSVFTLFNFTFSLIIFTKDHDSTSCAAYSPFSAQRKIKHNPSSPLLCVCATKKTLSLSIYPSQNVFCPRGKFELSILF